MKKCFRLIGIVMLVSCLAIVFSGCGETEETVSFTKAIPADGRTIQTDTEIIVIFDGTPTGLKANNGKVSLSGVNAKIKGPFTQGTLNLVLTWDGGSTSLTYTVAAPEPEEPDIPPPPEGMVLIPAGEFQMGSNDEDAPNDEQPVHSVYVDAFYMDKYEVTNAQYARFLNAKGKHAEGEITWYNIPKRAWMIRFVSGKYRVRLGYENHPVNYVSWYGAMAYAEWVDKRLPTEAEWEKAARGGLAGQKYPWGNTIDSTKANYDFDGGGPSGYTTVVGKYAANGYGLFDMAGNVREWCLDEYNKGFYSVSPVQNPLSGANSIEWLINNYKNVKRFRVLRGGDWTSEERFVRVAYRHYPLLFVESANYYGFRCVRVVTP